MALVSPSLQRAARPPLLALAGLGLLWAMWLGLSRLGVAPVVSPRALADHGALMVGGFLGTVISLERAVALGRTWGYLGPLACAAAIALHLAGEPAAGAAFLVAGGVGMVAVLARVLWADRAFHHAVLFLGALGFLAGNLLLALGRPVFDVVGLWMAFLALTISAERLELNRLLPRTRATRGTFIAAASLVVVGAAVSWAFRDTGMRLLGAGQLALCAWMFRFDLARRTVRQHGPVRFIAVSLLAGFAWLGVGGVLALAWGHPIAGPRYDALLHAVLVGFVFSMIFGHALVILPAVTGARVEYRPRFYAHLGLLHASVALRVCGDLVGSAPLRQLGAWLNVAAIVLFLVSTVLAVRRPRAAQRRSGPHEAGPGRGASSQAPVARTSDQRLVRGKAGREAEADVPGPIRDEL